MAQQDEAVLWSDGEFYVVLIRDDVTLTFGGSEYMEYYTVENLQTGVEEFRTPCLPDAISTAKQSLAALRFFGLVDSDDEGGETWDDVFDSDDEPTTH